jgi:histidine triad (HIT) family protein
LLKYPDSMDSVFTRIIRGDIPAYKVAENADFLAFLDIFPLEKGHVLVIPKKQVDYIFDLDNETYLLLWSFARGVARAIESVVPCERIGIAVVGLEVPHAHVHLIPLREVADINFSRPKKSFTTEEFLETATAIRKAWEAADSSTTPT